MIASVRGEVTVRRADHVVVECGGVGYRLAVSANTLRAVPAAGEETLLHTHLVLRDDGMHLYGFSSEEERELFPKVRKVMSRARLLELGEALQDAKQTAPTRPHPYSPDQPPGNALVGGAVAVVDRARNTGKQAVRRVRSEIPML